MADVRKNGKQYGLICSKKAPLSAPKAVNVFGEDDDSDMDDGTDWVKKAIKGEGEKNRVKKQTRLNMEKALNEDPTIYQYDEVFDEMERTKEQGKAIKKEVKKPKYIENLLKAADRRKREQEHRIERMVQKEREAEGAMFADKESFVTSAYRAKLEEFKKMEEEEQNMDRLEAIGDVTKQQDISGFYRHFFHQTVDPGKSGDTDKADIVKEEVNDDDEKSQDIVGEPNVDKDEVLPSGSSSEKSHNSDDEFQSKESKKSTKIIAKGKRSRQYRQRVVEASESESEEEEEAKKKEVETATEEDFPEDKRSNEEETEPVKKKRKSSVGDQRFGKDNKVIGEKSTEQTKQPETDALIQPKKVTKESLEIAEKAREEERKNKVSIWAKRTVGPVFDAALQRYYSRKAIRLSGS